MEKPMRKVSSIIFVLVFVAVVAANFKLMSRAMKEIGLVTLLLNSIMMVLGYTTSRLFKLDFKSAIS
jgi:BASS family bile acid:Na+ symporter